MEQGQDGPRESSVDAVAIGASRAKLTFPPKSNKSEDAFGWLSNVLLSWLHFVIAVFVRRHAGLTIEIVASGCRMRFGRGFWGRVDVVKDGAEERPKRRQTRRWVVTQSQLSRRFSCVG